MLSSVHTVSAGRQTDTDTQSTTGIDYFLHKIEHMGTCYDMALTKEKLDERFYTVYTAVFAISTKLTNIFQIK